MMKQLTRRSALKGIAAGALTLTFTGVVSADDETQYVTTTQGNRVADRVADAGFEVVNELADGDVLIVSGSEDSVDALEEVRGIQEVARNSFFGLEGPEKEEDEFELPAIWENQWDKHVTGVKDAHETATGAGATVAILDTGIDPDHPDLAGNVNEELSELFSSGNPIEDDDNPWDSNGHGTHVAGTVAATGDAGVIGTAPDAELVSLKVFWLEDPEGHENEDEPFLTTTTADILAAIDATADIDADAANMSLGTPPLPPEYNRFGIRVAYERVIQHATRQGTVVVASAGNSAANLQQGGYFTTPNSTAGAMSVSATAPNDELAYFSNYGTNEIDVGAPGGTYETPLKTLYGIREWYDAGQPTLRSDHPLEEGDDGELWLDEDGNIVFDREEADEIIEFTSPAWPYPFNLVFSTVPGSYAWFAGTSMAAPQVSGLAALVRELEPDANANKVERAIKRGADLAQGESDPELGAGRINAEDTVERLD